MAAKEFYKKYLADSTVYELNRKLLEVLQAYMPARVLEFGCGTGKNLKLLKGAGIRAVGIDISERAVDHCRKDGLEVFHGDELSLKLFRGRFDVAFTCSVLDHIEDVSEAAEDLKACAKTAVVLAETTDTPDKFYYAHDYARLGFKKIKYAWKSPEDKATYQIWIWERPLAGEDAVEAELARM